MKYILLSIRPEWCCKLMNGDKKTEVRRGTAIYNAISRLIKEQGKVPCLIYCTKGKPYLWKFWFDGDDECGYCYETSLAKDEYSPKVGEILNGKVVAEFEASAEIIESNQFSIRFTKTLNAFELEERSCLTQKQIGDYLVDDDNSPILGTAVHIHDLKAFDKPKELKEFRHPCKRPEIGDCETCFRRGLRGLGCHLGTSIEKAPQSWCYAEEKK